MYSRKKKSNWPLTSFFISFYSDYKVEQDLSFLYPPTPLPLQNVKLFYAHIMSIYYTVKQKYSCWLLEN